MFGKKKAKTLEPQPRPLAMWLPQTTQTEPGSPMAELARLAGKRDAWSGTRDTDRDAR